MGVDSDVELVGVELVFPTLGVVVVLLHGDIVVWDATLPHATAEARLLDRDVAGVAEKQDVARERVRTGTREGTPHAGVERGAAARRARHARHCGICAWLNK